MPERVLEIQALAPLLWRDGRPFAAAEGSETAARSLPLPLPSTVAGFVRTQVGKRQGLSFDDPQTLQNLHGLQVCAPLLVRGGQFVLPAPRDAVVYKNGKSLQVMRLLPKALETGYGCDLPEGLLPLEVTEDIKPESGYNFWTADDLTRWLLGQEVVPQKIGGLPEETRIHVGIDPATGKANEGVLYSVTYKALESLEEGQHHSWSIRARVRLPEGQEPEPLGYLGGESRPVRVMAYPNAKLSEYWFDCPAEIKEAYARLGRGSMLRMVLATPALFEGGWRPGWLDKFGQMNLPAGVGTVRLKLVAAAVGRREPVSGWSLRERKPRPVRWMVPAGSVYFFEVEEGDPSRLLESWLRPVSDHEQDRKDGFGLALWGVC
ncbi:type III-B CRISPR module-associated Cmr3 family protein [Meiothermus cerbereus]|uniref:type III-B CRISPR module-associated Cmr3 family protein n=1 Tax=Meiothermus cerbereus TaxID=65552 RepID=UPI003EEE25E3